MVKNQKIYGGKEHDRERKVQGAGLASSESVCFFRNTWNAVDTYSICSEYHYHVGDLRDFEKDSLCDGSS